MKTSFRMIALAVSIATGFAGGRLPAQTAQVPAGPPGGIDASKLPDTDGVHLGMSEEQAFAAMRKLFPGDTLTIYVQKLANGTGWVSLLSGDSGSPGESMAVHLSMPPNPVQVVSIMRVINLDPNKMPTVANTVASLRQKYGPELTTTKYPPGSGVFAWAYNEEGQPINPQGPSNWNPADCAGQAIGTTSGVAVYNPSPSQIPASPKLDAASGSQLTPVLGGTPLAQLLPGLTSNLCDRDVFVTARLTQASIQGMPVVSAISILLGEQSLAVRAAVAEEQYVAGVQAAKQQQGMKKAQQQKAPSL
jgi:hypothetical protein